MTAALLLFFLFTGASWQTRVVDLHNQLRGHLNLPPLRWSAALADRAQIWANTLIETGRFAHDPNHHGQNLFAMTGGNATADLVVQSWADEAAAYNYSRNSCSDVCGHYTQMVWRDTKYIGCAVARNASREVWVCDYDPPGNVVGEKPY